MNIKTKFTNNLIELENSKSSVNSIEFLKNKGLTYESLKETLTKSGETSSISSLDYYKYTNLLESIFSKTIVEVTDDQTTEENFDSRTASSYLREGENITVDGKTVKKITSYKFDILVKDKPRSEERRVGKEC